MSARLCGPLQVDGSLSRGQGSHPWISDSGVWCVQIWVLENCSPLLTVFGAGREHTYAESPIGSLCACLSCTHMSRVQLGAPSVDFFFRPCDRSLSRPPPRQRLRSLPSPVWDVPLQLCLLSAFSLQYEGKPGDF